MYTSLCQSYEAYEFHKVQEIEYFYQITKKHYLAKIFAHELATKLENNKFSKNYIQREGAPFELSLN